MKVYVANLGRYNEGELVGAWFTPPIDEEEMAERIGLNEDYEEYAIHDFELPFDVTNTRRLVKSTGYVKPFKKSKVHLFIMNSKKFKACGLVAWKNYWKTKRIFIVIVIVIRWKMSPVITWKKQDSLVKSLPIYKIILTTNLWDVIWK